MGIGARRTVAPEEGYGFLIGDVVVGGEPLGRLEKGVLMTGINKLGLIPFASPTFGQTSKRMVTLTETLFDLTMPFSKRPSVELAPAPASLQLK